MKTLIVGTGIIGTIYGWALHESGADVTHYVRKGRGGLYRDGIPMDILDERKGHKKYNRTVYPVKCVEAVHASDGYELVIVPTNSYQTKAAIEEIYPASPGSFYLILTSNWLGTEYIDRVIPRGQYLLGYPDGGGTLKDGAFWTNIGPELHVAKPSAENRDDFDKTAALFGKAGISADIQENMLHWLWLHNAMSTGIWAAFMKHRSVRPFLKDSSLLRKSYTATRECLALCEKRGIRLDSFPEVKAMMYPRPLFLIIFKLLYTYNESMKRYTAHAASSPAELKANFSEIMETARENNFPMPAMTELAQYV